MKKLFTLFLVLAASIGTTHAWDDEGVQIGDLRYYLNTSAKTAAVAPFSFDTEAEGGPYNLDGCIESAIIPASVEYEGDTYSVTHISDNAFFDCSELTSVIIPNSVTSIGGEAFELCWNLREITFPNSITSIGGSAFGGCVSLTSPLYNEHIIAYLPGSYSEAYTYIIPDGIEIIAGSFDECYGLTSLTIPNSVTTIEDWALSHPIPSLTTIICKAATPPSCGNYVFSGVEDKSIPLYVPKQSVEAYKAASDWKDFTNILPIDEPCQSYLFEEQTGTWDGREFEWRGKLINHAGTYHDSLQTVVGACDSVYQLEVERGLYETNFYCQTCDSTGYTDVIPPGEWWKSLDVYYVTFNSENPDIGYIETYAGALTRKLPFRITFSNESVAKISETNPNIIVAVGAGETLVTIDIDEDSDFRADHYGFIICVTDPIINPQKQYTISLSPNNPSYGIVNGAGIFPKDTTIAISALPNEGYHFVQWSDGNTDNPRQIVVTADSVFIAVFERNDIPVNTESGFSISANSKVYFAKGNLQYQASTSTWRFADNQYDIVGDSEVGNVYENGVKCNNYLIGDSYSGWIDLFGWGTGNSPTQYDLNADYSTFVDWGINSISNAPKNTTWRTPSLKEYNYLLYQRKNAASLYKISRINDQLGLVLLPDDWSFGSIQNNYSTAEWNEMEQHGAIFLPAGYSRIAQGVDRACVGGYYWTSTTNVSTYYATALRLWTNPSISSSLWVDINDYDVRAYGRFVRLITDVEEAKCAPASVIVMDTVITEGETIVWEGISINKAGTYEVRNMSTEGCDSIIYRLNLVTLPPSNNEQPVNVRVTCDETQGSVSVAGTFFLGNSIYISATPNEGYYFTGWSDGNTDCARYITLTQDTILVALFSNIKYNLLLNINHPEMGTIQGAGSFIPGTEVTINAIENRGFQFLGWYIKGRNGATTLCTMSPQHSFVITCDTLFTAYFEPVNMSSELTMIYVNSVPVEGFSPEKYNYIFNYPIGTSEQALPTIDDITWDLSDSYQTVTISQVGTNIILNVTSGRGFTTTYVLSFVIERLNQYSVTTLSNNDAWGRAIGGNVYNAGSTVEIGAFAKEGYQFYHWNNTINENPYSFTLTQDTSFIAMFLPDTEEGVITDVTSNSVHMEWEVKPWGNHGYWIWIYLDRDHKHWYCKMRFFADGTLDKFYWGPASNHYDGSEPNSVHPHNLRRSPARYFDTAFVISYDLTDIDSSTDYFYILESVDAKENAVSAVAGTFSTEGDPTTTINEVSNEQSPFGYRKLLRNGHIFIQKGDKTYTLQGQEIK